MRPLSNLASAVVLLSAFGCSDRETVGPTANVRVAAGSSVDPARNSEDALLKNGASAKVYCNPATWCRAIAYDFKDYKSDVWGRPYTLFTVYVQNLQGTYPAGGSTTPQPLNWFMFQFFEAIEDPEYVDAFWYANPSPIGSVGAGWANDWANDSPIGGRNYDIWESYDGGIIGCNGPEQWSAPAYVFQTCPRLGFDGWVKFSFKLVRVIGTRTEAHVRLDDFLFSFGTRVGTNFCTIGGGQPSTCPVLPYREAMRS